MSKDFDPKIMKDLAAIIIIINLLILRSNGDFFF